MPHEQIKAGATYLDVNIGPAESNGPELMTWAVKLLQENFNNVPLALDTANKQAIEAGIKVYNRTNGKPIVNSADAGSRISYIDLAAANDAIVHRSVLCRRHRQGQRRAHDALPSYARARPVAWAWKRPTCGSTRCSSSSRACRTSRWTF